MLSHLPTETSSQPTSYNKGPSPTSFSRWGPLPGLGGQNQYPSRPDIKGAGRALGPTLGSEHSPGPRVGGVEPDEAGGSQGPPGQGI